MEDSFADQESEIDDYDNEYDSEREIDQYNQQMSGLKLQVPQRKQTYLDYYDEDDNNEQYYNVDQDGSSNLMRDYDYDEQKRNDYRRKLQNQNPSAQYYLKSKEMQKIESGTYKYKNRLDEKNDDDAQMYGIDGLSAQEDLDL